MWRTKFFLCAKPPATRIPADKPASSRHRHQARTHAQAVSQAAEGGNCRYTCAYRSCVIGSIVVIEIDLTVLRPCRLTAHPFPIVLDAAQLSSPPQSLSLRRRPDLWRDFLNGDVL